ncbi:hypothetical protein [Streptosporangium saharense]|uniref:hypothetical protein n=1 Tax=Streptosporangium saharense TaxID=1706840 RepID=UPI003441157D
MGRSGDPRKRGWHSTGAKIPVPPSALTGERLEAAMLALKPGEHLWICMTVHRVDPVRMADPEHVAHLDIENLLMTGAISCYVCEDPYALAKNRPCPGDPMEAS